MDVAQRRVGSIERGLLVYVGIGKDDTEKDAQWMADKIANLRIFSDSEYKMNRSALDEQAEILVVSQFTLYADARKGRRPSYNDAAPPDSARTMYELFIRKMKASGLRVETGEYQAIMDVGYVNMGPVTILLDTQK